MKKIILSIVAVAALVALPMGVKAADGKTTSSTNANVTIVDLLTLTKGNELNFGTVANGTGGTVTVVAQEAAQLNPDVTGDIAVISTSSATAASFAVAGTASATYAITIPSSVSISSGKLEVGTLTLKTTNTATGSGTAYASVLDALGKDNIYIGGILTVSSGAPTGLQTVPFDVTVNYN